LKGGVKHLNPRQGITTFDRFCFYYTDAIAACVKHLNPRQGITTRAVSQGKSSARKTKCETPKSPPGDYNIRLFRF